jgi:hypothetical protein
MDRLAVARGPSSHANFRPVSSATRALVPAIASLHARHVNCGPCSSPRATSPRVRQVPARCRPRSLRGFGDRLAPPRHRWPHPSKGSARSSRRAHERRLGLRALELSIYETPSSSGFAVQARNPADGTLLPAGASGCPGALSPRRTRAQTLFALESRNALAADDLIAQGEYGLTSALGRREINSRSAIRGNSRSP